MSVRNAWNEGFTPAQRARWRLTFTLIVIIALSILITLGVARAFLLPHDAEARLHEHLRQQEEEKLKKGLPTGEHLPEPARPSDLEGAGGP